MSDRIVSRVAGGHGAPAPSPSAGPARTVTRGTFRDVLVAQQSAAPPSSTTSLIRDVARALDRGQRMVDGVIASARQGRVFSNEELLAVQAGVYRYTQELELASKVVDKATSAVQRTLQSQS